MREVSAAAGLQQSELLSKRRIKSVVRWRYLAMLLMYERRGMSMAEIARVCNAHHTTVGYALGIITTEIRSDSESDLAKKYEQIVGKCFDYQKSVYKRQTHDT